MTKISLNLVKEHLTRDEMRTISGGENCESNCSSVLYSCAYTDEHGWGLLCTCLGYSTLYNVFGQVACQEPPDQH